MLQYAINWFRSLRPVDLLLLASGLSLVDAFCAKFGLDWGTRWSPTENLILAVYFSLWHWRTSRSRKDSARVDDQIEPPVPDCYESEARATLHIKDATWDPKIFGK